MTHSLSQPAIAAPDSEKKKRGYYLHLEPHHARLYRMLVLARRSDVTQYELFGEMTRHFEQLISPARPLKSLLKAETGQEHIYIYYFEQDLPQIRALSLQNHVRIRHIVYAVMLHYLEALGVDEAGLNKKLHMFDELTQVSQSLLQSGADER
jgi:hypothetical protein